MDNRSRGFRLAAAAVMLVFLLAVSAFAMAEADPIRVSSLSEPQSVISEQDVSITIKIYNSSQTDMTEEISLYDPTGGVPVSTYNGLQGEQSVTYTGTWHVTQDQIKEGKIKYYIQYSFDSGNGLEKVVRAVPVTIQTEAAAPQLTATYTLSPTSARKGQKVAVEYTLSNTGNIELRNIAISNEGVSSKKLTAPSLSVGEKVTLQDSFTMGDSELVSKPTVTYQAAGGSKEYTISDMARKTVTLAEDGLEAQLKTDAGENLYPGEKINVTGNIYPHIQPSDGAEMMFLYATDADMRTAEAERGTRYETIYVSDDMQPEADQIYFARADEISNWDLEGFGYEESEGYALIYPAR